MSPTGCRCCPLGHGVQRLCECPSVVRVIRVIRVIEVIEVIRVTRVTRIIRVMGRFGAVEVAVCGILQDNVSTPCERCVIHE
jgi:hypothetical protein